MDWNELKGMELESTKGDKLFVAGIDEEGITIKFIETSEDAYCLNRKEQARNIVNLSYEDNFIFTLNCIYAGILIPVDEKIDYFGVKEEFKDSSDSLYRFLFCDQGTCAHQ